MKYLADITIAPNGGFSGAKNGTGLLAPPGDGITLFTKLLSTSVGLMTIIAFVWFVFTFFVGAIGIVTSGGDKGALESSKKKISTGIIGVVVVVAALFIIRFVGMILGIPNLLDLPTLFTAIQ